MKKFPYNQFFGTNFDSKILQNTKINLIISFIKKMALKTIIF